jgi:hypothetical protein
MVRVFFLLECLDLDSDRYCAYNKQFYTEEKQSIRVTSRFFISSYSAVFLSVTYTYHIRRIIEL